MTTPARLPISVFIIAKDEADRIGRTITSVRDWTDEVIVIDSGSTDTTVELAASLGARTVFNPWTGYGPQKVFGESLCRNAWILNLDADEELTAEAAAEIKTMFRDGEPVLKIFDLPFLEVRPYETKPRRFGLVKIYTRLYRKDHAGFRPSTVHDSVVAREPGMRIGRLKHGAWHRSLRSHAHTIAKINAYTTLQAEDLYRRGRNFGLLRVVFTPLLSFLMAYVVRGYMFYGIEGITDARIYAFSRVLRVAKTRERFRAAKTRTD
jgi:glycosyltransferase involved in cell wall biosynthesis